MMSRTACYTEGENRARTQASIDPAIHRQQAVQRTEWSLTAFCPPTT